MMGNAMNNMLIGAIVTVSLTVALFFLRYWRSTGDRFFLYFALSFFIEGFNRLLLGAASTQAGTVQHYAFYSLRLIAYGLILVAIWRKNSRRGKGP
jgi:hypothetical protein